METKIITDVNCKGRYPSNKPCNSEMYQSDGEFIYINGLILNPDLNEQVIECDKCGYKMHWRRNTQFITDANKNNPGGRRQWRTKNKFNKPKFIR